MENTVQGPSCNIRGTGIETLSLAFGDISQGYNGFLGLKTFYLGTLDESSS